ncbi:MAG: hypothetical protein EAZ92_03580 [Candidatus Kapaibacterium sp.]|nr:MAG: hypothetical protein EAZ92_03580 [Candidatus Kapabacteria bacterium]
MKKVPYFFFKFRIAKKLQKKLREVFQKTVLSRYSVPATPDVHSRYCIILTALEKYFQNYQQIKE